MPIKLSDLVPLSRARQKLPDLAREAHEEGREKIITRNGEAYVALIDAQQLEEYHRLAREHATLSWIREAHTGLKDVEEDNSVSFETFRKKWRKRQKNG